MAVLVAFTGLDGAGKSTQTAALADRLRGDGVPVTTVHQFDPATAVGRAIKTHARSIGEAALARVAREGTVKPTTDAARSTSAPTSTSVSARSNSTGIASRALSAYWLIRGWLKFSWVCAKGRRARGVVILDRCFLDEVVRSAWRCDANHALATALLERVPVPDATFHMDVSPDVGWGRKKKINVSEDAYRRKHKVVTEVVAEASTRWNVLTIDVDADDAATIGDRIYDEVTHRCKAS